MKKTLSLLISAVAFSSLAAGATILDSSIMGISNVQTGIIDYGTAKEHLNWSQNTTTNTVTITSSNNDFAFNGKNSTRTTMTIALSLDMSKLTFPEGSASSHLVTAGSGGMNTSWGVGLNGNGSATGTWGTNSSYSTTGADSLSSKTGIVDLVITTGELGTRIYIGDSGLYWTSSGLRGSSNYNSLFLNGEFIDAIQQLYVFDTTMTSHSQVKDIMDAMQAQRIPEPATAALSLLGLGALLWRRRRA